MASFVLTVTRGMFSVLEHLAPGAGGALAFRLFSRTSDPGKPSAREREAIKRFRPLMEEARRHRLRVSAGWVAAHVFKPLVGRGLGRTALVVHGWNSRSDHMMPVVMQLRAAGYRVVAIDLPGHGESTGRFLNMVTAVEACNEAALWFGPFDVAVGHSFGGAVALNAAAGSVRRFPPLPVGRLVLIAAPNSMPEFFAHFAGVLRLGRRVKRAFLGRVERLSGTPLGAFVGAQQLARLGVPTLVVHSGDDSEVPPDNARDLAGAGSHVALEWVSGTGHRRILADARTHDAMLRFVSDGELSATGVAARAGRAAA